MKDVTVYWSQHRVDALRSDPRSFRFLFGGPHVSQPSFRKAGIALGDRLHIVSVAAGRLWIHARARVVAVLDASDATPAWIRRNGEACAWQDRSGASRRVFDGALCVTCADHAVELDDMVGPRFDAALTEDELRAFTYLNRRGHRRPKGCEARRVTVPMAFQGIYRLGQATADVLSDRLMSGTPRPPSGPIDDLPLFAARSLR